MNPVNPKIRTVLVLDDNIALQIELKKKLEQKISLCKVVKAFSITQAEEDLKTHRQDLVAIIVDSHVLAKAGSPDPNTLAFIANAKRFLVARPVSFIGLARDLFAKRQMLAADCSHVFDKQDGDVIERLIGHLLTRLTPRAFRTLT